MRWAAFLRGINVGGHAVLRMPELVDRVGALGFADVRALRASGNLTLDAGATAEASIAAALERDLAEGKGLEVRVFLRSEGELGALVAADPFATPPPAGGTPYVTFLATPPGPSIAIPYHAPDGGIDLVARRGRDLLSWCRTVNGRPGFPNAYVERAAHAPATTRNWSTVLAIAERLAADGAATPARSSPSGSAPRRRRP